MLIKADVSAFQAAITDVRARLAKLNGDDSLSGLIARVERLLHDLPADIFECDPVPVAAGNIDPFPAVIVRPGPRLNAIVAAVRALDLDEVMHIDSPLNGGEPRLDRSANPDSTQDACR